MTHVKLSSVLVSLTVVLTACVASPAPMNPSHTLTGSGSADPYPDGVLPVGDGMWVVDGPRHGNVFLCREFAGSLRGNKGAVKRGPWFTDDGKGWRPDDKPHVRGSIPVRGHFDMRVEGDLRLIGTNGLPERHPIGQFPVAPDDPVRQYDPNPNHVREHVVLYSLPAQPEQAGTPQCVGSQVGVMLQGAALLSSIDMQGRDAVAWEVQDRCDGHPEPNGVYHYHGPSECLPGTDTDQVIGFAMDGFPITGNRGADGRELFSPDLDECHGGVADVVLDGEQVRTYRYVMTRDFPYTVACFRGEPVRIPPPER